MLSSWESLDIIVGNTGTQYSLAKCIYSYNTFVNLSYRHVVERCIHKTGRGIALIFMGHYSKQGHTLESFMLCNWILKIRKLTPHYKALVIEAIFPWPSRQEGNHYNLIQCPTAFPSLQITFPVLPSILVLPSSSEVKLKRHWSVRSCFKEADKCPLPTGAILEGCRQAKRCGERAHNKTGRGGSRKMLPDDFG